MGAASLQCRTYGHAWDEYSRPDLPDTAGWRLSLRCARCSTERHDVIDLIGGLSERRYVYPEGYRADFEDHRWTLPEYRQALYQRYRSRSTTTSRGAA
jgi:hypothetical protein